MDKKIISILMCIIMVTPVLIMTVITDYNSGSEIDIYPQNVNLFNLHISVKNIGENVIERLQVTLGYKGCVFSSC